LAASQSSSTFTISEDISQSLGVTLAAIAGVMSACGPKRTYRVALHMAAFGGKADKNLLYWRHGIAQFPRQAFKRARCFHSSLPADCRREATLRFWLAARAEA
jgi:hypothetical protein